MKKIVTFFAMLIALIAFTSCTNNNNTPKELKNEKISQEQKFGGVYIEITIDDFNKLGYNYGDSIDITFSNGYNLIDLPYYNGYYTNTGEELLVGYPGYPYIKACINNGNDLFKVAQLRDTDTANIKLNTKAKYKDIQEALDIHYSDIQGAMTDEVFGNYRVVNVGNLKKDILYRSASPDDNQHNRSKVVQGLIGKVNTIINLSDNDGELAENINKNDFNTSHYLDIYNNNRIIALSMNMNFKSVNGEEDETPALFTQFTENLFHTKLVSGLRFMLKNDGPYLVHCVEGKDRTGFVCMVIEAIAGASYDEIIADYMITYDNYYGINLNNNPTKYNIIKEKNIDEMLRTVINDEKVDIKTADYSKYIETYLLSKGLKKEEFDSLKAKITK